jgi:putative membrane protein
MELTLLLGKIMIGIIALLHVYILVLEMFLWITRGPKVFKSIPKHLFEPTKVLAANQGLYNGFLAAGLIWSLLVGDPIWSNHVATFFLVCIAIAGVYGSVTAQKSIFFIQTISSLFALILLNL